MTSLQQSMGRKGGQSTVAGVYSGSVKNPQYVMKRGAEENGRGVRSGRLLKWGKRIRSKGGYLRQR